MTHKADRTMDSLSLDDVGQLDELARLEARQTSLNDFLTTFDQERMTTAQQILAVGRFYDAAERAGFTRGFTAGERAALGAISAVNSALSPRPRDREGVT